MTTPKIPKPAKSPHDDIDQIVREEVRGSGGLLEMAMGLGDELAAVVAGMIAELERQKKAKADAGGFLHVDAGLPDLCSIDGDIDLNALAEAALAARDAWRDGIFPGDAEDVPL